MKKSLFVGMLLAAGMLFTTSCSRDNELNPVQSEGVAQVTFSLEAEGGISTRAISDGMSADLLYYAIFDADQKLITTIATSENGLLKKEGAFPNQSRTDKVTVTLAKGQEYTAVFWAQDASCNAYTVTAATDGLMVDVNYTGVNNDDTRDAFFRAEPFKVEGDVEIDVELKRPFAQINVGVTEADWNAAVASGITITESQVVIKNAAKSINLLDGTVGADTQVVTYDFAAIPATSNDVLEVDVDRNGTIDEDEKYKYLSMSYILTDNNADRTTLEADGLQFTFKSGGENIIFNEGLHAVPVQRNWRTNILGKILTGNIDFNISIDQEFIDDYNKLNPDADDDSDNSVISVATADELTNAIKNATGDVTVYFANDITGNATAEQKEGVDVVVNGNGYKYDGTITIDGNSRNTGAETLMFTNINFEHANGAIYFIECNSTAGDMRYAHNVTVKDCTFKGNSNGAVVGMRYRQCYNMSVINCTATDVFLLMWTTGGENITVDGADVTVNEGGEGGLSTSTTKNVSVKNSTITVNAANGYGVRINSSDNTGDLNLNVENNTITADVPILLRQANKYTCTINLIGDNILSTDEAYHIVAINAEYKDGLIPPTGVVNINGADKFNVYPDDASATSLNASSDAQISSIIDAGVSTINLTPGTYIIPDDAQGKTLTFIGTGNPEDTKIATQDDGSYEGCDYSLDGATVTFENITINTDSRTYTGYARCKGTYKNCIINGTYTLYGESTFEECTFNVSGDVYNIWTWGAQEASFTKCTFNSAGKSVLVYNQNLNITFDTCTFNDKGSISGKAAIETGVDNGSTKYTININNCTVNGFDTTTQNSVTYGGTNLGSNIWGNKNLITADNLDVKINNVDVY